MALNYVTVTWTQEDVTAAGLSGYITFQNSEILSTTTEGIIFPQVQKTFSFVGGSGSTSPLLATDNADVRQIGWSYNVTTTIGAVGPQATTFSCLLPYSGGSVQSLASIMPTSI